MFFKYKMGKMYLTLFLVSTILTALVTSFIFGVYQNYHTRVMQGEEQSYVISIEADKSVGIKTVHSEFYGQTEQDKENMSRYYTSISKGDVVEMFDNLPESVLESIDFVNTNIVADDNVYQLALYKFIFTPTKEGLVPYGTHADQFTDEQYLSGARVARVDEGLYDEDASYSHGTMFWSNDGNRVMDPDEEYVEINGIEYEIIGMTKGSAHQSGNIYIPFTALPDDTPLAGMEGTVSIYFKNTISYRDYKEISDYVEQNLFGKAHVAEIDLSLSSDLYYYKTIVLITLAVAFLFAVNAMAIYSCIIKKNMRQIKIYRLCGCPRLKIVASLTAYLSILSVPLFIASLLVFDKLIYPAILDFFPYMTGCFNFTVYLLMFVMWYVVTTVSSFILMFFKIGNKLDIMEGK